MRYAWFILSMLLLYSCESPEKTMSFFVEGNCETCQSYIQQSALEVAGVNTAQWQYDKSELTIHFNPDKTDAESVMLALSEAGFNSQFFDADPAARKSLPACCQEAIDRALKSTGGH
ncbi:MAG: heavy-metal-associated domain-containing protein [Bacteroidota bacterium]